MKDADPEKVSIVRDGAIGVPFRKYANAQRGSKMDFFGIFGGKNSEDVQKSTGPELVAIAVSSRLALKDAKAIAAAAGFAHADKIGELDGAHLLLKSEDVVLDAERDTQIVVRLSDSVAAIVEVEKAFTPFTESTEFSENLAGRSFISSFTSAGEVLNDTMFNIMLAEGASREETQSAVAKAVEEFAAFAKGLVEALPESVLKLEKVLKELPGITGPGSPDPGGAAEDQEGNEQIAQAPANEEAGKNNIMKDDGTDDAPEAETAQKDEPADEPVETIESAETRFAEMFATQKSEHESQLEKLNGTISALASELKTLKVKMDGTLMTDAPDETVPGNKPRETGGFFGSGDTGMLELEAVHQD